ncbi:ATP-dependent endonuclease [Desulfococcus sp.]|uniref:ATP-dependent nuclease n=1 Tax=Desulfococcus sp. TaxID=2025834 RepID=UPI0035944E96
MKLTDIKIENFRGIRSLHLPLGGLTVLIGENNTGKSTVLEAIRLVLTRGFGVRRGGQFTEYDFHLKDSAATPQTANSISITLHFAEEQQDEWPEEVIQQMEPDSQLDVNGLYHIWLRGEGAYNQGAGSFETKWAFLNNSGVELNLKNATPLNLISRFVPLFFLSALRDASQEFGQRGQFWSGFLKSIQLPDEQREKIEEMLREVNTSVIGANAGLTEVTKKIADAGRLVPLDSADPVALEAIPTRVFDMVGKIQVHLKSAYGAKLPLHRHGEGTQSLAVLMLFQAFTATNLAEAYAPESTPILALEEPEAHLHPSAIRSLGSFLEKMTGQILVTSHSGDLVSRVPVTALRRLYKRNGETKVGQVKSDVFSDRELQTIDYSIRLARGHYLFSRCWLLVEGESDFHLMPLLFELMGHSQDQVSFSVLEISQVIDKGEPLIKFAKALGIQWFLMADGDHAGNDYVNRANNHLGTGESLADRARALAHTDIEHEFWHNGYSDFMLSIVDPQTLNQITTQTANSVNKAKTLIEKAVKLVGYNDDAVQTLVGDVMAIIPPQTNNQAYSDVEKTKALIKSAIKQAGGKPAFAQALATEVRQRGANSIPQTIRDIIARVVQLAGG